MQVVRFSICAVLGALVVLAAGAMFTGCLVSGTKVFSQEIGDLTVNAAEFDKATVDLTENETYNDHREDIGLIDRVGFTCNLVNHSGVPAVVSVYISDNPNLATPAQVEAQGIVIFEDLAVPAAGDEIDYDESLSLLKNFSELQAAVESGIFTVYAVAGGNYNVTIADTVVIITFTVGL